MDNASPMITSYPFCKIGEPAGGRGEFTTPSFNFSFEKKKESFFSMGNFTHASDVALSKNSKKPSKDL